LGVRSLGCITREYTTLDFILVKHGGLRDVPRILQSTLKLVDDLRLQAIAAFIALGAQGLDKRPAITVQIRGDFGERLVPSLAEAFAVEQNLKINRCSPSNNPSLAECVQEEGSLLKGGCRSHSVLDLVSQGGIVTKNGLPLANGVDVRLKKGMQGFQIVLK
jgi:hypothetical protein